MAVLSSSAIRKLSTLHALKERELTSAESRLAGALAAGESLTDAARAAGLSVARATEWIQNDAYRARIHDMKRAALKLADVTPSRTLLELARVAFADVRDLYDEHGCLVNPSQLSDDAAASVASVEEDSRMDGRGEGAELVRTKKIKRHDKLGALGILARHHKIIGEVGDGVNELASALADRLNAAKVPVALEGPSDEEMAS